MSQTIVQTHPKMVLGESKSVKIEEGKKYAMVSMLSESGQMEETKFMIPEGMMLIEGVIGVADIKNENGRTYPFKEYKKHIKAMQPAIKKGLYGEMFHPDGMEIDMERRTHRILEIRIAEDGNVYGKFLLLDTPLGRICQSVARSGGEVPVSSRGYGSLDEKGIVTLELMKTWDVVNEGGFSQALMREAGVMTESKDFAGSAYTTLLFENVNGRRIAYKKFESLKGSEEGLITETKYNELYEMYTKVSERCNKMEARISTLEGGATCESCKKSHVSEGKPSKKDMYQYFMDNYEQHLDSSNVVNMTTLAEDYISEKNVDEKYEEMVFDAVVDWIEENKEELNLNEAVKVKKFATPQELQALENRLSVAVAEQLNKMAHGIKTFLKDDYVKVVENKVKGGVQAVVEGNNQKDVAKGLSEKLESLSTEFQTKLSEAVTKEEVADVLAKSIEDVVAETKAATEEINKQIEAISEKSANNTELVGISERIESINTNLKTLVEGTKEEILTFVKGSFIKENILPLVNESAKSYKAVEFEKSAKESLVEAVAEKTDIDAIDDMINQVDELSVNESNKTVQGFESTSTFLHMPKDLQEKWETLTDEKKAFLEKRSNTRNFPNKQSIVTFWESNRKEFFLGEEKLPTEKELEALRETKNGQAPIWKLDPNL